MVDRVCDCYECCKRENSGQQVFNKMCIQDNTMQNEKYLIKPCYVSLTKLDLLGHNGNTSSNCCLTFPDTNIIEESKANKKVDKLEHGNLIAENRCLNLSERERNYRRKRTEVLFKTLCETFNLLRAKKKYEAKKVNQDVIFSYSVENQGLMCSSKQLIGTLYQGNNQITKTCKISYLPKIEDTGKNFDDKQNYSENSRQLFEENDIENQVPPFRNFENKQTKHLPSSEMHRNNTQYPRKNCLVPSTSSVPKISSANPQLDLAIQADVMHFPLKTSNPDNVSKPQTKDNKFKNAINNNNKLEIKTPEDTVQKNFKNTPVCKYLFNENSMCLSNQNIKCTKKESVAVFDKSNIDIPNPEEHSALRLLSKTKKYPFLRNTVINNKNLHRTIKRDLKNNDSVRNKLVLAKVVKPCRVLIELLDFDHIFLSNGIGSYILKTKNVSKCEKSVKFSNNIISSTKFNEIPIVENVSKCTVTNKNLIEPRKMPLVKPCYVRLQDIFETLSNDEYLKLLFPLRRNNGIHDVLKFKRKKYSMALNKQKMKLLQKNIAKQKRIIKHKISAKKTNKMAKECLNYILLKRDLNVNISRNVNKVSSALTTVNKHNYDTFSNTLPKCPSNIFKIKQCSVLLHRINLDAYLDNNCCAIFKNLNDERFNQSSLHPNDEKSYKNSVQNSSIFQTGKKCSLKVDDISKLESKKINLGNHCVTEKPLKINKTTDNNRNLICDSNYKCVQCHKLIPSDDELYHHLCIGKRKKGYICDICETIFETTHELLNDLRYHYRFIS